MRLPGTGMHRWFNLRSDERAPTQLARERREALEACAPFTGAVRVDYEASMICGGVVTCRTDAPDGWISVFFCTVDEAVAFAAEANGTSEEAVEERIRVEMEYLNNLRRGKRAKAPDGQRRQE